MPANGLARPAKSVFPPGFESKINNGTMVVHVTDKRLAACMLAVGIRMREDPPYLRYRDGGTTVTVFNFLPTCDEGKLKAVDLKRAWENHLDFIAKNPLHPFAIAMAAVRNYGEIVDHFITKDPVPFVALRKFENGKTTTLLVKEGSKKYNMATEKGYKESR